MNVPGIFDEVSLLYARLEEELPGDLCAACGECCHFSASGHILFVTEVERMFFESKHPGYPRFDEPPGACPFLLGPLCTAREGRPLACRTYFCREDRSTREERYERYHAELRSIGGRYGIPYDYTPLFVKHAADAIHGCSGGGRRR